MKGRVYVYRDGKMIEKPDPNLVDFGPATKRVQDIAEFLDELLAYLLKRK